jgi:hypothetical protein
MPALAVSRSTCSAEEELAAEPEPEVAATRRTVPRGSAAGDLRIILCRGWGAIFAVVGEPTCRMPKSIDDL